MLYLMPFVIENIFIFFLLVLTSPFLYSLTLPLSVAQRCVSAVPINLRQIFPPHLINLASPYNPLNRAVDWMFV